MENDKQNQESQLETKNHFIKVLESKIFDRFERVSGVK